MECPHCHFGNPENTKFCVKCATPLPISDVALDAPTETLEIPLFILRTGSVLSDRFEVIEEIGQGGMGRVYKVRDREIGEKIALKLIRSEIASNEKIIERFRNELRIARRISHKNVCRMFDIGKDGKRKYITMEYISGEDLKKTIRRMGPLTIKKTLSISKQICLGLAEAHRLGVIHRDLKPHNIMIDREGNVRIMDFGIALSQEAKGITDSDMMIGTPHYLSPELVEGKKADQRSDIYSLGVIMFEMATGRIPFDGETTLSIAVKHKNEIPPDPRVFNAQIPELLSRVILKCMEKDPDLRYQTAENLCSELFAIEHEIPAEETAVSRFKAASRVSTVRMILPKVIGSVLLAVLIIAGGSFIFDRFSKNMKSHVPETAGQKWRNSIIVLPLRDFSPQKDEDPISLILTDMLILNLHTFRELRVLPLTTALAYQNSRLDINSIGRELNVNYVLEGTVLRTEGKLRINPQLSRASDGSIVWASTFENPEEEYPAIQSRITKAVARTLGIQRVEEKYLALVKKAPAEPVTNKYYVRGRHFEIRYYQFYGNTDFEKCVQNYLKVVNSNPEEALTFWRLGNIHEQCFVYSKMDKKYLDLMFMYYQKAYEINPDFAEANAGVG